MINNYPSVEAFELFINLKEKSPEFISLFIDDNLKKGLKGVHYQSLCFAIADFSSIRKPIQK
jgi:hypothetical protein